MTNWHDSSLMIVKSAHPAINEGPSLKMLNEISISKPANANVRIHIDDNSIYISMV
jgi:hypothetical protein